MANRVETAMAGLQTQLATINTLRDVVRAMVDPISPKLSPACGIVPSALDQSGAGQWDLEVEIGLVCRTQGDAVDAEIAALLAEVDGVLRAEATGIACGGRVERQSWQFVYDLRTAPAKIVGAAGRLHIEFDGALTTA